MTKGGSWVPGHDWQSPAKRREIAARRAAAVAAEAVPPTRWDDPFADSGTDPEVAEAGTRLAAAKDHGEW
jgi:hypothetical protein